MFVIDSKIISSAFLLVSIFKCIAIIVNYVRQLYLLYIYMYAFRYHVFFSLQLEFRDSFIRFRHQFSQ